MYRKFAMGQYQIDKDNEASARIHEAIVALLQEERLPSEVSSVPMRLQNEEGSVGKRSTRSTIFPSGIRAIHLLRC
jgi:hypothetical protein